MSGTDAPLESLADLRGVAILVVDDDRDTRAMLDAALQADGRHRGQQPVSPGGAAGAPPAVSSISP